MPNKICPQCNTKHGVRKLTCFCGHEFSKPKSKSTPTTLTPEPGNWVADTIKGMPTITPPAPLDNEPLTVQEVAEHVAYEGLGYCIYAYIPTHKIADKKLQDLWRKAQAAMRQVNSYLVGHGHG